MGELVLTEDALQEAISTLNEVEQKMNLVFKGVGKSDIADIVHRATTFLKSSSIKTITISQFMRHFENDVDKFMLDRIVSTLEVSRIIRIIHKPGCEDIIQVIDD
jgi:hypothetical protein